MKALFHTFSQVIIVLMLTTASCSKENINGPDTPLPNLNLTGHILHQYTSDVKRINAATGEESSFFSYSAYSTVGWDVSRDGTLRLISSREAGTYDRNRLRLVRVADEVILKDFDYVPQYGNNTNNMGELSFDKSLIVIPPDRDNGIVILDTDGEVRHRIEGINDQTLGVDDKVTWLPNNELLVCFDKKFILRSKPPYSNLTLVKEMNYENWGNVRVSNDGSKLTMYINNHVYMMDIDGSNLTQVTEGNNEEIFGEFSPDDKFLLIGADYFHAPASSNSHWYLKIIPADGKKYNMDTGTGVIPVIPNGSNSIVRANKVTRWRP